jgi:hypothetical protein
MRALAGLIGAALALAAIGAASADPKPADGYALTVTHQPGAVFAGLARDGDDLLVTNLADGRLYRGLPGGSLAPFGPTLPHGVDVIGDPTGPYGIARVGDHYLVAEGWTPVDADEGPDDHALLKIDAAGAIRVLENDFWNPYAFALSGGRLYVIDAARNSVERLGADGTGKTTLFSFARLNAQESALKSLSPTEFKDAKTYDFDAVPTGIAVHDGRIYVSLFAGFPFIAGSGRIVSLPETGAAPSPQIDAADLNAPVDVGFDAAGEMLILEHGTYDQANGFAPGSGRLLAVDASGKRRVLLDGLTRPAALLVFDEHQTVVSQLDGTLIFLKRNAD